MQSLQETFSYSFNHDLVHYPQLSGCLLLLYKLESGEQRYIHIPVLPLVESGELTVRVTAFSILDIDTEEKTITTRVPYIGYHMIFKIMKYSHKQ